MSNKISMSGEDIAKMIDSFEKAGHEIENVTSLNSEPQDPDDSETDDDEAEMDQDEDWVMKAGKTIKRAKLPFVTEAICKHMGEDTDELVITTDDTTYRFNLRKVTDVEILPAGEVT